MRILNPRNLPAAIINAAIQEEKVINMNRVGVLDLIGPAYLRRLKLQRWNELEEEVESRWRIIIGIALHYYLDSKAPEGSIHDEKMVLKLGDWELAGVPDIHHNGEIHDYKYTSVYAYIFGKIEWEQQLNVYAYMARQCGHDIKGVKIIAFFYDWNELDMLRNPDYPKQPILEIPVPMWTEEEQREYVEKRISAHCEPIAPCSPEERWRRPSVWAVMKEGRKSAMRVMPSHDEAYEWAVKNDLICKDGDMAGEPKKGIAIVERRGEDRRCQGFCPVRKICPESVYNQRETTDEDRED